MAGLVVIAVTLLAGAALVWHLVRPASPAGTRLFAATGWVRRGTTLGLLAAVVFGSVVWLGGLKAPIAFVRDAGNSLMTVEVQTAPLTWVSVSSVVETPTTVTVVVSRLGPPLSWFEYDREWLLVPLAAPLGNRTVIDGTTGLEIPKW